MEEFVYFIAYVVWDYDEHDWLLCDDVIVMHEPIRSKATMEKARAKAIEQCEAYIPKDDEPAFYFTALTLIYQSHRNVYDKWVAADSAARELADRGGVPWWRRPRNDR